MVIFAKNADGKIFVRIADIIVAIKQTHGGINHVILECLKDCSVLLMANKNVYQDSQEIVYADKYFSSFYGCLRIRIDYQGRLMTLSECGRYEDYFIVPVPGEFLMDEVPHSERLQAFIEEFKRTNKK